MQDSPEELIPFVDVAETHSGAVLFIGDRAYKMKKPLDLGFVDYRTVESRRAACEEEVRLNRRLAPDVYLGVGSLSSIGHDEPVVVMRRLPAGRRLSQLIAGGARGAGGGDAEACVDQLAPLLATFHREAPRTDTADRAASVMATAARWEHNAAEMQPFEGRFFQEGVLDALLDEVRRYLAGRDALFRHRIDAGRARDGHGDLLTQDIFCGRDGPAVLDCLEFDETLRAGDVLADVAFLAMDLERLGRPELSWRFLEMHRELLDDDWPVSLAHHHIAYRAQVRAKVACIRAAQGVITDEDPELLLQLASGHLGRGRVELVVVGGLPGSGKSTVAEALAQHRGAVTLSSDEVRKELAGIEPLESAAAPPGQGIYDAEHTARTYAELVRRARRALEMGESVVLDASFTDPASREAPRRLAEDVSAALIELHCVAPPAVLEERVTQRAAAGPSTSDADRTILASLSQQAAPWPGAIRLDTTRALAESVDEAMGAMDAAGNDC